MGSTGNDCVTYPVEDASVQEILAYPDDTSAPTQAGTEDYHSGANIEQSQPSYWCTHDQPTPSISSSLTSTRPVSTEVETSAAIQSY